MVRRGGGGRVSGQVGGVGSGVVSMELGEFEGLACSASSPSSSPPSSSTFSPPPPPPPPINEGAAGVLDEGVQGVHKGLLQVFFLFFNVMIFCYNFNFLFICLAQPSRFGGL